MSPSTHTAIATPAPLQPVVQVTVPTVPSTGTNILIHVLYTSSTPLDLHQADGGLLISASQYPFILGSGISGTVVSTGPDAHKFRSGDLVFGFTWKTQAEHAHQEYVTAEEELFGLMPRGKGLEEAATVPTNFVTVWHTFVVDLGIKLPWPPGEKVDVKGEETERVVLVWGGSSSVGMYALQVLRYAGYTNVVTTGSRRHWGMLRGYGAKKCFDYNEEDVAQQVVEYANGLRTWHDGLAVPLILDCIGSRDKSVRPIAEIAQKGSVVAIMLPVVVVDANEEGITPEYSMDVGRCSVTWTEGVTAKGVRTHFYTDHAFHREKLQSEIMPRLWEMGVIQPNKVKMVEGKTMLERAQKALDMLRRKEVSGERLVWRVSDVKEGEDGGGA